MDLNISKGVHFRGNSIYIKSANSEMRGIINSYKVYYDNNSDIYELPSTCFNSLVDRLDCLGEDINIIGELSKQQERYLSLLDTYYKPDLEYNSKTKPYTYQLDSFNYALDKNKFILGDEQGLGKSKQALDIAISRKHKMKHCLIVCGVNGLKWNWIKEISIHTNEKGHIIGLNSKGKIGSVDKRLKDLESSHDEFFLITNIETLRNSRFQKKIKELCTKGTIGMTIIDEIHKCKNPTSQQGKAIHYCCSYYKLALTGTPLMNSPVDLYNILKWLEVENHSYSWFKNRYCVMGGFGGYEIVGYKHLDNLERHLNNVMLRRTKDQVLDLPPKNKILDIIEMDNTQSKIYFSVKENLRKNINKILLNNNPLTQLIRLRQATGIPSLLTDLKVKNSKFERMEEIVEESVNNNNKVIIFSNWTSVINPAYKILKNYNPALVTGEVKNISKEISKFKTDKSCKVILGTISCLGTGFTLNEANTIIFLDEPWTYAAKAQAEDRAHRIGTKGTINIYTLLCKGTIDENIHEIVQNKKNLSDAIVDKKKFVEDVLK